MTEQIKCKSIFSPRLARELLKEGYIIKDIKPSRESTDRTIFLFEATPSFLKRFEELSSAKSSVTVAEVAQHGIELGVID